MALAELSVEKLEEYRKKIGHNIDKIFHAVNELKALFGSGVFEHVRPGVRLGDAVEKLREGGYALYTLVDQIRKGDDVSTVEKITEAVLKLTDVRDYISHALYHFETLVPGLRETASKIRDALSEVTTKLKEILDYCHKTEPKAIAACVGRRLDEIVKTLESAAEKIREAVVRLPVPIV